jgi:hypothetical protein
MALQGLATLHVARHLLLTNAGQVGVGTKLAALDATLQVQDALANDDLVRLTDAGRQALAEGV